MSPVLPLLSGREVVKALQRGGYVVRRQRGSHIRLYHADRLPVTVPDHREVDRRTLKSIVRTTGWTEEEFKQWL